jgi:hypothetical protein
VSAWKDAPVDSAPALTDVIAGRVPTRSEIARWAEVAKAAHISAN